MGVNLIQVEPSAYLLIKECGQDLGCYHLVSLESMHFTIWKSCYPLPTR